MYKAKAGQATQQPQPQQGWGSQPLPEAPVVSAPQGGLRPPAQPGVVQAPTANDPNAIAPPSELPW